MKITHNGIEGVFLTKKENKIIIISIFLIFIGGILSGCVWALILLRCLRGG